jgi:hypothetical protein
MDSWLAINAFYPGVAKAVTECRGESVLVTTKHVEGMPPTLLHRCSVWSGCSLLTKPAETVRSRFPLLLLSLSPHIGQTAALRNRADALRGC